MAHNASDDKVHLAGEGLSADSQEPVAVEAANASLRDRLLRALAEVENTRRRSERSVADAREYAISNFALLHLGPDLDHLSHELVAEDVALLHSRDVAVVKV